MPRGRVWPKDSDAVQTQVLTALSQEFERTTTDANALLVDEFPATTLNLLPEWEASLGLPDPCAGESSTIQARRGQVVARLIATGGQSAAYFIGVAAALGYSITITQFSAFHFGSTFGSPLCGTDWAFAWQVNAPQFTVNKFKFGQSVFGEPFASWGNTVLQCELQQLAPAHTIVIFSYS